jgi:hypothetical protein
MENGTKIEVLLKDYPQIAKAFNELSSLLSLTSRLGNPTISETVVKGFGGKDVLSPKR